MNKRNKTLYSVVLIIIASGCRINYHHSMLACLMRGQAGLCREKVTELLDQLSKSPDLNIAMKARHNLSVVKEVEELEKE